MTDLIDTELATAGCEAPGIEKHRFALSRIQALNRTCLVTLWIYLHLLHNCGPFISDWGENLPEIHDYLGERVGIGL